MYNLLKLYEKGTRKEHVICDIGCGPGIAASFFARRGFNIIGIDVVEKMVQFGNKYFKKYGLEGRFVTADITKNEPVFDSIRCNVIICIDAIEHFADPIKSIQNFKKILGTSGKVFLTTPNFGNPLFTLIERTWDVVGKTPGWGHLHVTRLGLTKYKQLFEHEGFKIESGGTFLFVTPFISIFSTRLARFFSKLEQYFLKKVPVGLMLYIVASFNEGE
nr:class I SAM-dependent methyltransferase [Candidatus Sigynarchaeota archaeon]